MVALRLAWRDAWKHMGRSSLIVALIALPVAGMALIVLLLTSSQQTTEERIAAELGTAQARLSTLYSGGVGTIQDPLNPGFLVGAAEPDEGFVPAELSDVVPNGFTTVEESSIFLKLEIGNLPIHSRVVVSELFHPGFASRFTLAEGLQSDDSSAVYLSPSLAERLGLLVGEQLTSAGQFKVAGVIRETGPISQGETIYVLPGTDLPLSGESENTWLYLFGDQSLTWPEIRSMNIEGVAALSRSVLLDPPSADELPAGLGTPTQPSTVMVVLGVAVGGILVLAEVGLLAGAAFAVGARGQRRMLALLAAAGGEKSLVRWVVTASGVVLGTIGTALGLLAGVAIAAAVVAWHTARYSPAFPGFHLVWWPLTVFAALGLCCAVVAAAVPARAIAAQNAFTAIRSAQSASIPAPKTPRAGLTLIAIALLSGGAGVVIALTASTPGEYSDRFTIVAPLLSLGTLLFLLGVLFCTGRIVDILAGLASRLPIVARIAARDASRNRSRSVPSIAAVLAATAVAGIVVVSSATFAKDISDQQMNALNEGQGAVSLLKFDETAGTATTIAHDPLIHNIESVLGPVENTILVSGISTACSEDEPCLQLSLSLPEENSCVALAARDEGDVWACDDPQASNVPGFPTFTIGGPETLEAVLGHAPPPDALDALKQGHLVVLDPAWISEGEVTIIGNSFNQSTGQPSEPVEYTMPAFATEPDEPLAIAGVMSPDAAASLGFEAQVQSVVLELPRTPTPAEHDAIHAAFNEAGSEPAWLYFPAPPPATESLLWAVAGIAALVALTSSGITAGLALADGKADHMTLAGIGAAPKVRKSLAAAQTGLTAAVGVSLGLLCGVLPAVVVFSSARLYELVVPWPQIGTILTLVPIIGAVAAWLFTRARLPMTHRALIH